MLPIDKYIAIGYLLAPLPASRATAAHDLVDAGWIHLSEAATPDQLHLKILPDDVARQQINRDNRKLRKALGLLLEGVYLTNNNRFDTAATFEEGSLFYIFNTLPSPAPKKTQIRDRWSRKGVNWLLDGNNASLGLRTSLYKYQRRSAAAMLEREVEPQRVLDPRLETRVSADGATYYYGPRDKTFLKEPRYYDTVRGGILAETMGLGKTIICIALILASKGHWPQIPPQFEKDEQNLRDSVPSLFELAVSTVRKQRIPWRQHFDLVGLTRGEALEQCEEALMQSPPRYSIAPREIRNHRKSKVVGPAKEMLLTSATLIIVPKNLLHQWRSELSAHVEEGALSVKVVEQKSDFLPAAEELALYDIVLFSRPRFEDEVKQSQEPYYASPLAKLHWLRVIIDEGHSFSAAETNAALGAEKLITAERRWVVSGTPAKDLLGVETHMDALASSADQEKVAAIRSSTLAARKKFSFEDELESGALKCIETLTSRFLQAQPWARTQVDGTIDDTANWDDNVYRHLHVTSRTYSGFSKCLRSTLQNLVIKTRPEDVERELQLPPMTHTIVRLEPSYYDKLTANLFVLVFITNAVTSERRDQDYLFHRGSKMHLHRLIGNLRQSAFFWTGFNEESVTAGLEVAQKYLAKTDARCSLEDRRLLTDCVEAAREALASPLWRAIVDTAEMGLFVEGWPDDGGAWAFPGCESDPHVVPLSLAFEAQKLVNNQLPSGTPLDGFSGQGLRSKWDMVKAAAEERAVDKSSSSSSKKGKKSDADTDENKTMVVSGVPTSSLSSDTMGSRRLSVHGTAKAVTSPVKKRAAPGASTSKSSIASTSSPTSNSPANTAPTTHTRHRRLSFGDPSVTLPRTSPLGQTSVAGTASAKLSYLLSQILTHHRHEKTLVFYSGAHIAYYISQALDLFAIPHLIYSNTLTGPQKSKYVVLFESSAATRVLLMDVSQAAHGLNLSSASRVYFVNFVGRPDVEAQAVKRAHRIGQKRPVTVETLVLRGTVEEAMLDRAARMSSADHAKAKAHLEDDESIARILKGQKVLPTEPREMFGEGQMAPLREKEQVFGRPGRGGRGDRSVSALEREVFGAGVRDEDGPVGDEEEVGAAKKKRRRKSSGGGGSGSKKAGRLKEGSGEDNAGPSTGLNVEEQQQQQLSPYEDMRAYWARLLMGSGVQVE